MSTSKLRVPVSERDHADGAANAPVVLVEYGDYECPYCGEAFPIVKQLQKALKGRLRFVFRNFPLSEMHPHARRAAAAAEAAALQNRFWEMHDSLFTHQSRLTERDLLFYAERLRLDVKRLVVAMDSPEVQERIDADIESGARSGVNGTPTFFIQGVRHDVDYSYETLFQALTTAG